MSAVRAARLDLASNTGATAEWTLTFADLDPQAVVAFDVVGPVAVVAVDTTTATLTLTTDEPVESRYWILADGVPIVGGLAVVDGATGPTCSYCLPVTVATPVGNVTVADA